MPEQQKNIFWMAEEIDFELKKEDQQEARDSISEFLHVVANPIFAHWLY